MNAHAGRDGDGAALGPAVSMRILPGKPGKRNPWHPKLRSLNWQGRLDLLMARRFPKVWDDIELRLRHRWPIARVIQWCETVHPGQPYPRVRTLQRVLHERGEEWFVPQLLAVPPGATPSRLLIVEEQIQAINVQKMRLNAMIQFEKEMKIPVAEVRENLRLLTMMYHDHLKTGQEFGIYPRAPRVSSS